MKPPRCKPKETWVESGDFWHKLYQMASMIIFHEAFNPPSHILFIVCIQNRNNMYSIYTYILYVYICVYIMCVCNNIYIYNMYIIFIYIQYIMLHLQTDTGKWHVQGLSNKTWMSSCKALWKHLEDKKVKWSSQLSQFSSKHTILHMHCVVSLSALRPKVDATTSPCSLCSGCNICKASVWYCPTPNMFIQNQASDFVFHKT